MLRSPLALANRCPRPEARPGGREIAPRIASDRAIPARTPAGAPRRAHSPVPRDVPWHAAAGTDAAFGMDSPAIPGRAPVSPPRGARTAPAGAHTPRRPSAPASTLRPRFHGLGSRRADAVGVEEPGQDLDPGHDPRTRPGEVRRPVDPVRTSALAARQPRSVEACPRDARTVEDAGREVAFVRHRGEPVLEAENGDDLRSRSRTSIRSAAPWEFRSWVRSRVSSPYTRDPADTRQGRGGGSGDVCEGGCGGESGGSCVVVRGGVVGMPPAPRHGTRNFARPRLLARVVPRLEECRYLPREAAPGSPTISRRFLARATPGRFAARISLPHVDTPPRRFARSSAVRIRREDHGRKPVPSFPPTFDLAGMGWAIYGNRALARPALGVPTPENPVPGDPVPG